MSVRGELPPLRPRRGARAMGGNLAAAAAIVKVRLPRGAASLEVAPRAQPRGARREVAPRLGILHRAGERRDRGLLVCLPWRANEVGAQ